MAGLWSIWLARNEKIFRKTSMSNQCLIQVYLFRTFNWALENGWLERSQSLKWCSQPQRALLEIEGNKIKELWERISHKSDLVIFIDGSWIPNSDIGGMGGIIRTGCKRLKSVFYGPFQCWAALDSEIASLKMSLTLCRSYYNNLSVIICTDSKVMVEDFKRFKLFQDSSTLVGQMLLNEKVQLSSISMVHICRDLNREAHDLAKKGRREPTLNIRHLE